MDFEAFFDDGERRKDLRMERETERECVREILSAKGMWKNKKRWREIEREMPSARRLRK